MSYVATFIPVILAILAKELCRLFHFGMHKYLQWFHIPWNDLHKQAIWWSTTVGNNNRNILDEVNAQLELLRTIKVALNLLCVMRKYVSMLQ